MVSLKWNWKQNSQWRVGLCDTTTLDKESEHYWLCIIIKLIQPWLALQNLCLCSSNWSPGPPGTPEMSLSFIVFSKKEMLHSFCHTIPLRLALWDKLIVTVSTFNTVFLFLQRFSVISLAAYLSIYLSIRTKSKASVGPCCSVDTFRIIWNYWAPECARGRSGHVCSTKICTVLKISRSIVALFMNSLSNVTSLKLACIFSFWHSQ